MEHNKIINIIIDYIYSDEQLNKIFNHHNQKYTLKELLLLLIKILYNNIPYREIKNYTNIHWCTIYNFHMKLLQYDIFKRIHNSVVNNYLSKLDKSTKLLYTDTSLILNKLGMDMISNNSQLKKIIMPKGIIIFFN